MYQQKSEQNLKNLAKAIMALKTQSFRDMSLNVSECLCLQKGAGFCCQIQKKSNQQTIFLEQVPSSLIFSEAVIPKTLFCGAMFRRRLRGVVEMLRNPWGMDLSKDSGLQRASLSFSRQVKGTIHPPFPLLPPFTPPPCNVGGGP